MQRPRNEFVTDFLLPVAIIAGVLLLVALAPGCASPEQRNRFLSSVELFASTTSGTTDWTTREGDVDSTQLGVKCNPFAGLEPPQRIIIEREPAPPALDPALEAAMRSAILGVPGVAGATAAFLVPPMVPDELAEARAYLEAERAGATTPATSVPAQVTPPEPAAAAPDRMDELVRRLRAAKHRRCCCHEAPPPGPNPAPP